MLRIGLPAASHSRSEQWYLNFQINAESVALIERTKASLRGDRARFDHKQGRWLLWEKQKGPWLWDNQGRVRLLMKSTARHRLSAAFGSSEGDKKLG